MDRDQEKFLKGILQMIMRSAVNTTMWRLPLWITIALGLAAAGAVWYWKLF
ncbi:hypothetical protein BH11PLA2_BH11PLA2_44860 [soil metagenome]